MSVRFKVTVQIKERIKSGFADAKQNVKSELYNFGEEIMADSKQVVPVDTGNLMSTGHVELPVENGNRMTVQLGYGGPAAPYAIYVHEDMRANVNWTRPGSGPKYLENPLKAKQDQFPVRMGDAFKKGFTK